MTSRRRLLALLVLAPALASGLAGCGGATARKADTDLPLALYAYSGAIRWGRLDEAWAWVHPDVQAARPLDTLTRERWEQVQVSGYEVKTSGPTPDGRLSQRVEIRVINRHTQVERVLRVEETWGWDEEAQRWWNYSGLPDLTAGPR
jgi:hypothetical protein